MAKILFIDDDTHTLYLMEQISLILGHEAFLCPAAKDAMRMALATLPDLVMIDINMQEVNGFDVVRRLRENEITQDTPMTVLGQVGNMFQVKLADGTTGYVAQTAIEVKATEMLTGLITGMKLIDDVPNVIVDGQTIPVTFIKEVNL